jgi:hypothetical protein
MTWERCRAYAEFSKTESYFHTAPEASKSRICEGGTPTVRIHRSEKLMSPGAVWCRFLERNRVLPTRKFHLGSSLTCTVSGGTGGTGLMKFVRRNLLQGVFWIYIAALRPRSG